MNNASRDVQDVKNIFHPETGFKPSGWYRFTCPGCGAEVETRFREQGTCGKPECEMRIITVFIPEIRIQQLEGAVRKGYAMNRSILIRDIIAAAMDAMQDWPSAVALPPAGTEAIVEVKRGKCTLPVRVTARREQIYLLVRQSSNGLSAREVANHIDVSVQLANWYLNELIERGQVVVLSEVRPGTRRPNGVKVYHARQTTAEALGWQKTQPGDVAG